MPPPQLNLYLCKQDLNKEVKVCKGRLERPVSCNQWQPAMANGTYCQNQI